MRESVQANALHLRQVLAVSAVAVALAAAIIGALSGHGESGLAIAIATASGGATDALQPIADRLPLGYAFAAGMAAAVNPCGFALLPTYLGLYLGTTTKRADSHWHGASIVGRALLVGASMTLAFVGLFGAMGLVLSVGSSVVGPALPWVSLSVGCVLVLIGGFMLGGGRLTFSGVEQAAGGIGGAAASISVVGYAAYGLAFALSSLGCTLPLFLAVVGSALASGGVPGGLLEFLLYALGMGLVVTVLTVSVAMFGLALVRRVRRLGRYLEPLSAFLLLVTGAYVVYYWLSAGGLLG
jgi:cytochrome c-type biogenesis protein